MKKFFALILTVAVCFSSLSFSACSTIPQSSHNFSDEWSYDTTHHWKACEDEDCETVTKKTKHSFTDGVCECGAEEDSTPIGGNGGSGSGSGSSSSSDSSGGSSSTNQGGSSTQKGESKITKENWEKAFTFNNVTMKNYIYAEGKAEYNSSYLFDGEKLMLSAPNHESVTTDAEIIKTTKSIYNFSSCFESATYKDGKYYIESFSPYSGIEFKDVYLTFSDNYLILMETYWTETNENQQIKVEFSNYGTTKIEESGSGNQGSSSSGSSGIHPDYNGGNTNNIDPNFGDNNADVENPNLNDDNNADVNSPNLNDDSNLDNNHQEPSIVYLDNENEIYHIDRNCEQNLSISKLEYAQHKNYSPCPKCVE